MFVFALLLILLLILLFAVVSVLAWKYYISDRASRSHRHHLKANIVTRKVDIEDGVHITSRDKQLKIGAQNGIEIDTKTGPLVLKGPSSSWVVDASGKDKGLSISNDGGEVIVTPSGDIVTTSGKICNPEKQCLDIGEMAKISKDIDKIMAEIDSKENMAA